MSANPPSFRLPVNVRGSVPDNVAETIENHDDAITDLQQAIPELKSQINALKTPQTTSATTTTENVTSTSTTVITSNVIGSVNDQTGNVTYSTQQSDYGAFILLNDASSIAVTLTVAPVITLPWFTTFLNTGTGTATLTPVSGTIDGSGTFTLFGGQVVTVVFDGTNFEIFPLLALPFTFGAISHQFLTAYNDATGAFTAAQPAFTDISGTLAAGQLPADVPVVSFGAGAPAGSSTEGYIYFNVSVSPYNGYVYHSGAWNQFS